MQNDYSEIELLIRIDDAKEILLKLFKTVADDSPAFDIIENHIKELEASRADN